MRTVSEAKWSATELTEISEADDLKISPLRDDGVTYGTPTWIWNVVVDGELYVRAYHGKKSRWYQAAIKNKTGQIHAAKRRVNVVFIPADEKMNNLIDEAYQKKYKGSPYLSAMINESAKSATVRIVPK